MHIRRTTHCYRGPPIDVPPYTVLQSCTCYAWAHPKCHACRRSNRSPVYVSFARTQEGFRTLHYVLHAGIDLIDAHQASRVARPHDRASQAVNGTHRPVGVPRGAVRAAHSFAVRLGIMHASAAHYGGDSQRAARDKSCGDHIRFTAQSCAP